MIETFSDVIKYLVKCKFILKRIKPLFEKMSFSIKFSSKHTHKIAFEWLYGESIHVIGLSGIKIFNIEVYDTQKHVDLVSVIEHAMQMSFVLSISG